MKYLSSEPKMLKEHIIQTYGEVTQRHEIDHKKVQLAQSMVFL